MGVEVLYVVLGRPETYLCVGSEQVRSNVGKVETDMVAGKLLECKGRGKGTAARAPAPRRTVAPRKKSVPTPIARTETSQ